MWHWLAHFFGFTSGDGSGSPYLFWSGAGSDIGELGIVVGLAALIRRHNCHAKGCPRLGRHPVAGTTYVVCRKHHPDGKPTPAHIREQYHLYLGGKPGKGRRG